MQKILKLWVIVAKIHSLEGKHQKAVKFSKNVIFKCKFQDPCEIIFFGIKFYLKMLRVFYFLAIFFMYFQKIWKILKKNWTFRNIIRLCNKWQIEDFISSRSYGHSWLWKVFFLCTVIRGDIGYGDEIWVLNPIKKRDWVIQKSKKLYEPINNYFKYKEQNLPQDPIFLASHKNSKFIHKFNLQHSIDK